LPNHGANDGALVVPLSASDIRDFRPLLTLAALVLGIVLPADVAPDPEVPFWLGGSLPAPGPARPDAVLSGRSGWALARVAGWTVFLRAGRYRHRPSHLDALHIDVRYRDREVVVDAGSFAYNAPAPWNNGLATSFVHNGPVLDGREIAQRGPRFLWLTWPHARIVSARRDGDGATLTAERPGQVARRIEIGARAVRVLDRVLDPAARQIQVTWLMHPDAVNDFALRADGAQRLVAREGEVSGWFSPTYGQRLATTAVRLCRAAGPVETVIEPLTEGDA
jgi:hypothetical protein